MKKQITLKRGDETLLHQVDSCHCKKGVEIAITSKRPEDLDLIVYEFTSSAEAVFRRAMRLSS